MALCIERDLGAGLSHREEEARRVARGASEGIVAALRISSSLLFAARSITAAASGAVRQCAARPATAASVVADFRRSDRDFRVIPGMPRRATELHSTIHRIASTFPVAAS